jgi:hypothetical protein
VKNVIPGQIVQFMTFVVMLIAAYTVTVKMVNVSVKNVGQVTVAN